MNKKSKPESPFTGRWRITWMDQWDQDFVDEEVEALVSEKSGQDHLHKKKLQKELADINKEARKLKTRLKALERRRAELMEELDG